MSDRRKLGRLGQEIRAARLRQGHALRHVAAARGIHLRTLHAWETGEHHIPALRLVELADFVWLDLCRIARKALRAKKAAKP